MGEADDTPESPIPSKHLRLPSGMRLGKGLRRAWTEMMAHAEFCAAQAERAPVAAVHEFRKSIRRCRAMLRLLEPLLPGDVYREVRRQLRDIHRATSALRDADVVLHTLGSLALTADVAEPAALQIAHAGPVAADGSRAFLGELASALPGLADQIASALPKRVRQRALVKSIAHSYRRTRRSLRASERAIDDQALHDFRKRTKELRYQVELFIDGSTKRKAVRLGRRLTYLTDALGHIVDLMVLQAHAHDSVESELRPFVLAAATEQREQAEEDAFERAHKLFSRSPDKFAQRLMRMNRRS